MAGRQRVITLVHGTWATDAAWVKADSKLCQALSRIEPPPVIRSFRWSGHNSHRARLQAAEALQRQLAETFAEFPAAEHHVIGHSHGGNVVLYAVRDAAVCERIASVVCLATPFIHAQARPIEPAFTVLRLVLYSLGLAPGAALAIVALLFALMASQAAPDSPLGQFLGDTGVPLAVILAGLTGLSGFLIWGGLRVARWLDGWLVALLRPKIERYQTRMVHDYNHRAVRPLPVLNAQVKRDEPALWLQVLRRLSEPTGDVRATVPLAAFLALALGGSLLWEYSHDPTATASFFDIALYAMITVVIAWLAWLFLLVFFMVAAHLTFMLVPFIVRGHGGGFGEWSLYANWLMLIEARPEPARGYRLESVRIATHGKGLHHSQIYEEERVIARIVQWLTISTPKSGPGNGGS